MFALVKDHNLSHQKQNGTEMKQKFEKNSHNGHVTLNLDLSDNRDYVGSHVEFLFRLKMTFSGIKQ